MHRCAPVITKITLLTRKRRLLTLNYQVNELTSHDNLCI